MADLRWSYDRAERRWNFSGFVSDHDLAGLDLERLDKMVIESPVKAPADLLQSLEIIFRRLQEQAQPCLSNAEQKAQAARCECRGADDMCPCQNVTDATTRRERAASA